MAVSSALLVVDTQVGFFDNDFHVDGASELLERLACLVDGARKAKIPVFFVRHDTDPAIDGPIHPRLCGEKDPVFAKLTPDAFADTGLHQALTGMGINSLYLSGFQSELCIDTSLRRALALGYQVTLVSDCHGTFDGMEDGLTGRQLAARYNETLGRLAALRGSEQLMAEWNV
jgi:nicotinamidase-related amidase